VEYYEMVAHKKSSNNITIYLMCKLNGNSLDFDVLYKSHDYICYEFINSYFIAVSMCKLVSDFLWGPRNTPCPENVDLVI
jgi:hypothetical protein